MELSKYTSGIIFIDDQLSQVQFLIDYCEKQNVNVLYINPDDFNPKILYFGYRIVFIDLAFDDRIPDFKRVINILRGISDKGESHLLVVAWTQHEGDIELLKKEIENKMSDILPLAVLNAQKSNLMSLNNSDPENFNKLISQIFDDFLNNNISLFNLLEWEENHFKSIREEFNNFLEQPYTDEINPLLIDDKLGLYASNTLAPENILSAFEVLNIKISDNVLSKLNSMNINKLDYNKTKFKFYDKYKFNYEMMFDGSKNNNDIPGSIYKIEEYAYEKLKAINEDGQKDENSSIKNLFAQLKNKKINFSKIIHVLVDITPNCTFSSHNKNTTYCEGYLIFDIKEYSDIYNKIKEIKGYSKNCEEKCIFSFIDENNYFSHLIVCFDLCRSDKKEEYNKIFQLKNSLKISIQQKYSSWVSRVGDILNH